MRDNYLHQTGDENKIFSREGINIFLDGFVPTENLRFREDSLVFKVSENATEEDVKRMNR